MIETPSVDWLALSPTLALLAGGGIALLAAVLRAGVDAQGGRGDRGLRRLRRSSDLRGRRLRRERDPGGAARGVDDPRPAGRARAALPRGDGSGRRLRLLERAAPRRPRRVLRAPRRGGRGDGVLRRGREPDDALPRPRVVLALPVRPRRLRHRARDLARGRAQVRDRRRLRLRGAALRIGAGVRRDRRARLLADRGRGRRGATPSSSRGWR